MRNKVLIGFITLILIFTIIGCENKNLKQTEGNNVNVNLSETSSVEASGNKLEKLSKKNIFEIFKLTKDEVLEKLGNEFDIVPAGGEGVLDGYYYKDLGVTIVFDDDNTVIFIDCDSVVEIDGAKAGMNFQQVQEKLGKTEIQETWVETPDNKAYEIFYTLDNYILTFLSFNEDGSDSELTITSKE